MEHFSGPGEFHACSRNACKSEAIATLSCDYRARRVALVDLEPSGEPDHFHLCAEHLSRFRPPVGWEIEDCRTTADAVREQARVSA
jgi:uncharacterized protein DUF3499